MKNNLLKFYTVVFCLCLPFLIWAQPGTEDENGTGNLESIDAPVPIDSYIWVLIPIGLIFMFFKLNSKNRISNS